MKKTLLTTITCLGLTACVGFGKTETEVLKAAAINDAKQAPKELHQAFLQCYGLKDVDKKGCQRAAGSSHERYVNASNWEYILPFRYEAERMGFKDFLNGKGKACTELNEGPKYDPKQKVYVVHCSNNKQYNMRWEWQKGSWQLEE